MPRKPFALSSGISNARLQELRWLCYRLDELEQGDEPTNNDKVYAIYECLNNSTEGYENLKPYLFEYITKPGMSFENLVAKGIPCSHGLFYKLRRTFYERLDDALKTV
jgi:hypothetical protein